jgi:hypothetical protein
VCVEVVVVGGRSGACRVLVIGEDGGSFTGLGGPGAKECTARCVMVLIDGLVFDNDCQ